MPEVRQSLHDVMKGRGTTPSSSSNPTVPARCSIARSFIAASASPVRNAPISPTIRSPKSSTNNRSGSCAIPVVAKSNRRIGRYRPRPRRASTTSPISGSQACTRISRRSRNSRRRCAAWSTSAFFEIARMASCGFFFVLSVIDCGQTVVASAATMFYDTEGEAIMADTLTIPITTLVDDVTIPVYAYPGDAGMYLRAIEHVVLKPFERALVATGLAIAIPEGYAGFVQPRSGLAIKQGVTVLNTPGLNRQPLSRRAQGGPHQSRSRKRLRGSAGRPHRAARHPESRKRRCTVVDSLDETERGEGGFGLSGVA